jgi:NADPH:quinone reductase-like Zn-dependent oxidoreductase
VQAFVVDPGAPGGISEQEVAEPSAAPGRAVVEVAAVSLNRGELLHVGRHRLLDHRAPFGWDVAGVVVAAATDGTGPAVGSAVFGWSGDRGTWADRVAVRVGQLAPLPAGLSFEDASTLGVAGLTASAAVGRAPAPLPGARVVVTGATGGVGAFAVQLAALEGAETTAVVRDPAGAAALGGWFPSGVAVEVGLDVEGAPADLVIDSVGGDVLTSALQRVRAGGVVVSLGRTADAPAQVPAAWFLKHAQLHGLAISQAYDDRTTAPALTRLADLVVAGRLRTNVGLVADRRDALAAVRAVLDRQVRGKAVIRMR